MAMCISFVRWFNECFDSRALFTWVLPKFNEDTFNTDLFVNDVVFCRVFAGIGYRL